MMRKEAIHNDFLMKKEKNMGLFKKKPKTIYPKGTYRVYLNGSGKQKDPIAQTIDITEDSEFLAVAAAEKQYYPHLRVAKVEKVGEVWPEGKKPESEEK